MNVHKVTVEFIMMGSDWAPEWVTVQVGDKVIDNAKVSTVRLVEETTKKGLVRTKATNMVYDKETRRKIKRKRNHQRVNSDGVLVHRYVSAEYLAAASTLSVGKFSRFEGKRCAWLTVDERYLVSEAVKERRKK
jgi:hypothetical protein